MTTDLFHKITEESCPRMKLTRNEGGRGQTIGGAERSSPTPHDNISFLLPYSPKLKFLYQKAISLAKTVTYLTYSKILFIFSFFFNLNVIIILGNVYS